jgi:N-acetylmuramoyl-L-alanine amidase
MRTQAIAKSPIHSTGFNVIPDQAEPASPVDVVTAVPQQTAIGEPASPPTSAESVSMATSNEPTSSPAPAEPASPPPSDEPASVPVPTRIPPIPEPDPVVSDVSNRIGILAGHWGYDTGAICPDGLAEVDITTDVAKRAAVKLRALGYQVDILKEHYPGEPRPPLQGYQAAALVALHVDSCFPGISGFKIARWEYSPMPKIEDRLVQCLYAEYGANTGLPRHDTSITTDMRNYYVFREIAEPTPGAIIELGFMMDDRKILVDQPDLAAQGVVSGLRCFLENPIED